MLHLREAARPASLPLDSSIIDIWLSVEMLHFRGHKWKFPERPNSHASFPKQSTFFGFRPHCDRPFLPKNGYIRVPDSIYTKLGLPAELFHFCEAARSPSLFP